MRNMLKLGIILMLISAVAGGALAFVNGFTQPRIEAAARLALEKAQREVLPAADSFELRADLKSKASGSDAAIIDQVYVAKSGDKIVGLVILTRPHGYSNSDPLGVLVGLNDKGQVAGVRVTEQKDTPGLGSRVAEKEFIAQPAIAAANVGGELKVKKDGGTVDAITGATISSRGSLTGINAAFRLYKAVAGELGLAS